MFVEQPLASPGSAKYKIRGGGRGELPPAYSPIIHIGWLKKSRKVEISEKFIVTRKKQKIVIAAQYYWYALLPEVSTNSWRGCFELSHTDIQKDIWILRLYDWFGVDAVKVYASHNTPKLVLLHPANQPPSHVTRPSETSPAAAGHQAG